MSIITENRFNLIDEPWIPILGSRPVSLLHIFSHTDCRALGGNPIQKIALTKLLLAIAHAAYTPKDDEDWAALGADGLAKKCLDYLSKWHDHFYLYGDQPFLQVPAIAEAEIKSFGTVMPEISTGNTTVLTQDQIEKSLTDADKVLLIVQLVGFGLGGKKTDNSVILSPGYQGKYNEKGKPSTAKPSASLGFLGFLHSFLHGSNIQQSLWLNILTKQQVIDLGVYPLGVGVAPWEHMPVGEACPLAENLKLSLMGRLVPISRFCLLAEAGLHYSDGIMHAGYKEGAIDPSVSVNFSGKEVKAIWSDPGKRPWRLLTSLLSFYSLAKTGGFDCPQLRLGLPRAINQMAKIGIWSGGLKVSNNAGEQFVSGSDDYVESVVYLETASLGDLWFDNLNREMEELNGLSKMVYSATLHYFKAQNSEAKDRSSQATTLFWQLCERNFTQLINACDPSKEVGLLRPIFAKFVNKSYDTYCARDTARQIDSWSKNRPNLSKYLPNMNKDAV